MRLQTMYVDMRPAIVKWLGFAFVFLSGILFLYSFQPDILRAAAQAKEAYSQSSKDGGFDFGYLDACVRSADCLKSFVVTWSAPVPIKAMILGSLIFGAFCATFGLLWRPEVVAMRDTRVNAAKVEESKIKSPTPPRRAL